MWLPLNTNVPNTGTYADFKYKVDSVTNDLTGHASNLCSTYETDFINSVENLVWDATDPRSIYYVKFGLLHPTHDYKCFIDPSLFKDWLYIDNADMANSVRVYYGYDSVNTLAF